MLPSSKPSPRRARSNGFRAIDLFLLRLTAGLVALAALAHALAMLVGVSNCLKIALASA